MTLARSVMVLALVVVAGLSTSLAHAQYAPLLPASATSTPRGVYLHARTGQSDPWATLCVAPCERIELVRDVMLGLSLDGQDVRDAGRFTIEEGAALHLRFESQQRTRTYGLVLTVIGVVGALTLGIGGTVAWLSAGGQGDMTGPVTAMATGAGVLALGLSFGIVLMNEGDHVEITLAPR